MNARLVQDRRSFAPAFRCGKPDKHGAMNCNGEFGSPMVERGEPPMLSLRGGVPQPLPVTLACPRCGTVQTVALLPGWPGAG